MSTPCSAISPGLYEDPGPAPGYPVGDHTMPVLQDLPGDHWRDFFAALVNVTEAVSPERDERWSLKSWALRYPVPETKLRTEDEAIGQVHHHSPAMFSSVFYLQLPTSGYTPEQLGTVFRHPVPGAGDLFSPQPGDFPRLRSGPVVVFRATSTTRRRSRSLASRGPTGSWWSPTCFLPTAMTAGHRAARLVDLALAA
jgi:hypothetical protein